MAKKKQSGKFIPLLVLAAVLAVLLIGYRVLLKSNAEKAAKEAAEEAAANAEQFIAEYDYTTASKLTYAVGGGEEIELVCENGVWRWTGDEHFPVNQTTAAGMAYAISTIAVDREVTEGSLEEYGLDDPAYQIAITYADGTSHTYRIGDYNSFGGTYYFLADGDMYMIAPGLLPYFDYTLDQLVQTDTIPSSDWSDVNYVNSVTVTTPDGTNTITDADGKTAVTELLGSLSTMDWADYYADGDERAAYGLDGSTTVAVAYKKAVTTTDEAGNSSTSYLDTTYTITFGAADEDGDVYFALPKSDVICLTDAETVSSLLGYLTYVPEPADEGTAV